MDFRINKLVAPSIIFIFIINGNLSYAQMLENSSIQILPTINHSKIIQNGIQTIVQQNKTEYKFDVIQIQSSTLKELEQWYNSHPYIKFASLVEGTITIKFIDESYTVLLDVIPQKYSENIEDKKTIYNYPEILFHSSEDRIKSALILNPSEYLYGNRHCKRIINTLHNSGYSIEYLINTDVDLSYIRNNLNAEIIYMNTHAGFWDLDGDHQGDVVVIATGEYWTNETEEIYNFEFENQMIVEGVVGNQSFIAFTPLFIEYYYQSNNLPESLVYMATCHATYDDSMANAFLESGAKAYLGWTRNTIYWTNSYISVIAFKLFSKGFTVRQVCLLIRHGGMINFFLRSKLTYYGNGRCRIATISITKT